MHMPGPRRLRVNSLMSHMVQGVSVLAHMRPHLLGVTSCPPPTWRYGPRKSML